MSNQNPMQFVHQYMREIFSIIALVIAGFSAWIPLFFSGTGMTLFFLILGVISGMFFPDQMHSMVHKCCGKLSQGVSSAIVMGCIEIAIALFLPFVYFGWIGVLAGSSCHCSHKNCQTHSNDPSKHH